MAEAALSCIAIDWGTSNRRAWALGRDGAVVRQRSDAKGLLAHPERNFAQSLGAFLGDWLAEAPMAPIIMAGMIGSRLGWVEVPYLSVPLPLADLAGHLCQAGEVGGSACWIVPGLSMDDPVQPEVMRGEECQVLGALLAMREAHSLFVLPGTHSKWARVAEGRLTSFRTYMTGELFDLLGRSGTLAQLMTAEQEDAESYRLGVTNSADAELLNRLFSVRSLALFGRLPAAGARSYLSGLLVGAEIRHLMATWPEAVGTGAICIGSAAMIARYDAAARQLGLSLRGLENETILPRALHWIARNAGLLGS